MVGLMALSPVWAQQNSPPVLQGNVREAVYSSPVKPVSLSPASLPSGFVTQARDNQAMAGVSVQVPSMNYKTVTGKDGSFQLPPLSGKPVIAGFAKQGYVPQTVTLDQDSQTPLVISLRELHQTLVLDNEIRHLGDNSYSPVSAGAEKFRRSAEGVKLVRKFTLNHPVTNQAWLEIGSVIGLDTAAAHQLGQSGFHRVSSPMLVKLNGKLVTEINANGDGLRIPVTPQMLNMQGANTLEIVTGYQMPDGAYVDYDDIELMLLTLDY
jgi:hypothetical protein